MVFTHLWWSWIPWPCRLVVGTGSQSEEPETGRAGGAVPKPACGVEVLRMAPRSILFGGEGQRRWLEVCGGPVVSETIQF